MKLTILGCHSATPRWDANPTAQVLEVKGHLFLIDCAEGTQVQLRKFKIKFSRIRHVFISHLHGDHFFGLIGLIATFRLLGREAELHIYGPKGIKEAITLQLKLGASWTNYPLLFHELDSKEPTLIFEDEKVSVTTIPLNHRVYTNGFLIREKPGERGLDVDKARSLNVEMSYYRKIKGGADAVTKDGKIIPNAQITFDPEPTKSYAYCSDTGYFPQIVDQIKEVDMLYHEATFQEDHLELAEKTKHSTAKQAAAIARKAAVGTLVLGHYSGRYQDLEGFRTEAREIFDNVVLSEDGKVIEI
ncbi:MAG: ribonuclease Z [Bacteroidia bacterium]|nr:ribonuclease Z [Bacteroidia bacterium]NNM22539.1 ribonuclease Z [Flavobacteriaceae bacterium]